MQPQMELHFHKDSPPESEIKEAVCRRFEQEFCTAIVNIANAGLHSCDIARMLLHAAGSLMGGGAKKIVEQINKNPKPGVQPLVLNENYHKDFNPAPTGAQEILCLTMAAVATHMRDFPEAIAALVAARGIAQKAGTWSAGKEKDFLRTMDKIASKLEASHSDEECDGIGCPVHGKDSPVEIAKALGAQVVEIPGGAMIVGKGDVGKQLLEALGLVARDPKDIN